MDRSSSPTRSWNPTASSDGPSKTVCPRRVGGRRVLPSLPRRVNLHFCYLAFLLRGSLPGRGPPLRAGFQGLGFDSILGRWMGANQVCWRLTNPLPPLAVQPWEGHFSALSLTFPTWAMEMKVPFFGWVLHGFLLVGLFIL